MARARRVVVLTGVPLCHNPRAHKEARTLAAAGFDVEILGGWTDTELAARDRELLASERFRYTPVVDLTQPGFASSLRRLYFRMRTRAATLVFDAFGHESPWQLGYAAGALLRAARARNADLYVGHTELGLAAAGALQRSGRRVAVDMEDWYSEDLLPEARARRPCRLLRQLERDLLRGGACASCPSRAMSAVLVDVYGCRPPVPIYNAFSWDDRETTDGDYRDRQPSGPPSVHWFSQTVGPGRGLEDLFAALNHVERPYELHLRGRPTAGFDDWLTATVDPRVRARTVLHDIVPPQQLLSRIAEHDIGFAGEMLYARSRDLTVTNKILHYLLGGLAVIASDTAGQREVAEQAPGAVSLYPSGDPVALAARLNGLLDATDRLHCAKEAALRAAQSVFCWERQEEILVRMVHQALGAKTGAA